MRVPTPEIVEYKAHRSMADAFGPGAALAEPERDSENKVTAIDWFSAICFGAGAGVVLYLVTAFAAGPGA